MNYVLYLLKIILSFFDKHDKNIKQSINLYTEDNYLKELLGFYNQQVVMLLILVIKKILSNSEFEKATLDIEADSKIDDVYLTFNLKPKFSLNATYKRDGEENEIIDISYIRKKILISQNQSIAIDPILVELLSGMKSDDKDKLLLIITVIYSCQLTTSRFLVYQQKKSKESYDRDKEQIIKFSYNIIFKLIFLLYGDSNPINDVFSNVMPICKCENLDVRCNEVRKKIKEIVKPDPNCNKKEHNCINKIIEFIINDQNIIDLINGTNNANVIQINDKKFFENDLLLTFVNCYDVLYQMSKKIKFDKNFNVRGREERCHILIALLFRTDFRYNKHYKIITKELSSGIFGFFYLLYKKSQSFSPVLVDKCNIGDNPKLADFYKDKNSIFFKD